MTVLLVIADDFTGALDTGVQFASKGIRTRVITGSETYTAGSIYDSDVLVIDAETRHLSADLAYQKIYRLVESVFKNGVSYIYKKTDSALRGNIGAELSAALQAAHENQLMFLPAYPQMKRTTQNCVQYIDGIPVSQSVFGKDPFTPVTESDCRKLIALQCETPVIAAGVIQTPDEIPDEKGIVVIDALKTEDLACAGRCIKEAGKLHVMAGCAGFASVLPGLLDLPVRPQTDVIPEADLLVVCGSVNPITVAQLDDAEENGFLRIRLNPVQKLDENHWHTEEGKNELETIRTQFRKTSVRILDANDENHGQSTSEEAKRRGMSLEETRRRIADSIGESLSLIIGNESFGTMLITGGDTLLACMKHMGVHELEPVCELDAGVVLSRMYRQSREYWIISKSGGFGEKDLLLRIAQKLNNKGID